MPAPRKTHRNEKRDVDVVKKADRTAYDVRYLATKPNRQKCGVWNSYGHVTMLPMAITDAKISVVRIFAVYCG